MDRKNHLLFFSSLDYDGHFIDNIIDESVDVISLLLSILTAFLTFILGIEVLVLGFLSSSYGILMFGAVVIAFLQGINEAIKSI